MIDQENKYPVEFLGWGIVPDEMVKNIDVESFVLKEKKDYSQEKLLIVGAGYKFSDEQIIALCETIERVGYCIKEMADAIIKALKPVIKWIKNIGIDELFYFNPPEKKKIYQADYRMKSNVKNYGYKHNYRKRMFCVGGYGNFRRF